MEFIVPTYGNYNDLVYAVGVISRITHADSFSGLLFITAGLAMLVGLFQTVGGALFRGGKINYGWGINLILGGIFVFTLIWPTATVIIEDKYYGKSGTAGYFQAIKDVPFGAAMMIWFYSYTQEIVTNMIDDYGAPVVSIGDGGMDVSYALITNMDGMMGAAQTAAPQFVANVQNYVRDCVLPGVATDQILIENLAKPGATENLWDEMRLSANAITTVYHNSVNDTIMSCPQAHSSITAAFRSTEVIKIRDAYCTENNIAMVNGKVDSQGCEDKIGNLTEAFFHKSAPDYMMTYIAASSAKTVAESYVDLADKQTYVANAIAAVQAEKWLPKLRSNTFIVVVLLAPIVFLLVFFAPGSVIKWYGGMYVWLILWGAVDQLMFVMYQKELYDVFSNMRASGLGFLQVLDVKAEMLETMGLYGKMRWASMSLSLAMCMGILKIGNNAMVGIAENMGASAQQTAGQAASALSGVGGTDAAREQMIRQQTRGWAASVTPDEAIANQELLQHFQDTQNAAAMTDAFGGAYQAAYAGGQNQALGAQEAASRREKLGELYDGNAGIANKTGELAAHNTQKNVVDMELVQAQAERAGVDSKDIMAFNASGNLVTDESKAMVAKLTGIDESQLRKGMTLDLRNWNGDGFDNIVATEASFEGDKGMAGSMTTRFGDDGKMTEARFSGTYNGADATVVYDGNGNIIREQSTSGFNRSHEEVTSSRKGTSKEEFYVNTYNKTTGSTITRNDNVNTVNTGDSLNIGNQSSIDAATGSVAAISKIGFFSNGTAYTAAALEQINSYIEKNQSDSGFVKTEGTLSFGGNLVGLLGGTVSIGAGDTNTYNNLRGFTIDAIEKIQNSSHTVDEKNAMAAEVFEKLNDEFRLFTSPSNGITIYAPDGTEQAPIPGAALLPGSYWQDPETGLWLKNGNSGKIMPIGKNSPMS